MNRWVVAALLWVPITASAQDYQAPNTLLWASVGSPWLLGVRGEAWMADQVSFELGGGGLGPDATLGFDWAARWRPDPLCINCGNRDLITLGVGPGGWVIPPIDDDAWGLAVGGDLGANYVHWFTPTFGFTLSARGGVGAGWVDLAFDDAELAWWAFGGAGMTF